MLKTLRSLALLTAVLASQFALRATAAPQKLLNGEVYMGSFDESEPSAYDIYLVPSSIQPRGDMKRFQEHYVYRQEQDDELGGGYKYQQSIAYWVANCREGTSDLQKLDKLDAPGNKVGEFYTHFRLRVPEPGSAKEKALDYVCSYKH